LYEVQTLVGGKSRSRSAYDVVEVCPSCCCRDGDATTRGGVTASEAARRLSSYRTARSIDDRSAMTAQLCLRSRGSVTRRDRQSDALIAA